MLEVRSAESYEQFKRIIRDDVQQKDYLTIRGLEAVPVDVDARVAQRHYRIVKKRVKLYFQLREADLEKHGRPVKPLIIEWSTAIDPGTKMIHGVPVDLTKRRVSSQSRAA